MWARVAAVDLVDHHDGAQAVAEGFAQHEFGLRHWAFLGVNNEQAAVGHAQRTLNFTGEIGVAGSVDNVDLVVTVGNSRSFG